MPGSSTVTSTAFSVSTMSTSGRELALYARRRRLPDQETSVIHFGKSISKSISRGTRANKGVNVRVMAFLLPLRRAGRLRRSRRGFAKYDFPHNHRLEAGLGDVVRLALPLATPPSPTIHFE